MVMKIPANDAGWKYDASVWEDSSKFGEDRLLDMQGGQSAKSQNYYTMTGNAFKLVSLGDPSDYVQWNYFTGTARDTVTREDGVRTITGGTWNGISVASYPGWGAVRSDYPEAVSTSTYRSGMGSEYSCCGLYAKVRIGTITGGYSGGDGHAAASFKGVGGIVQARDGHANSCCNYGLSTTDISSSEPQGFALFVAGSSSDPRECRDGTMETSSATSCQAIYECTQSAVDGKFWLHNLDGVAYQVYCAFANNKGFTMVMKIPYGDAGWNYDQALWTDSSHFGAEFLTDIQAQKSAKSVNYFDMQGSAFMLVDLGSSDSVEWSYSGTARDMVTSGAEHSIASGSWASIAEQGYSGWGKPAAYGYPEHVKTSKGATLGSAYSCCGVGVQVRIGTYNGGYSSAFGGSVNGHSATTFKGVGGKVQARDGHENACCNYGQLGPQYYSASSTSGFALFVGGSV